MSEIAKDTGKATTAYFHLPGLFEFYEFYLEFLPLFYEHGEYFYDWCRIGSIYGSPEDCLWGGGRIEAGNTQPDKALSLVNKYNISARLTFSNSLLEKNHLSDRKCNELCKLFEADGRNGIIIASDLLLDYLKETYPAFYFVSSTTKTLTEWDALREELKCKDYRYVVPDFRLNKIIERLDSLTNEEKEKVEFLCNECCFIGCRDRKLCYESVSKKSLGIDDDFKCTSPGAGHGYLFSEAMKNPAFISRDDILNIYMPMGFSNFKIEGRGLGSALILEFILYYMTRPEYQINVREALYLSNTLDLF